MPWTASKPRITSVNTAPSRWRVERHATLRGRGAGEPASEYTWCAFHNENDIEETHRHFATWQAALDYADEQARTTTTTLPRIPTYPTWHRFGPHNIGIEIHHYSRHYAYMCFTDLEGIVIPNDQLEEIGQYMLALAKQREMNR